MVIFTRYPAKLSGYQMSVVHLCVWKQTLFMQATKDTEMKKFDRSQLNQFIGTEKYYLISRRHLLTDGTKYLSRQEIPYTDFPMNSITLYACWDQENWVIMLPSEY